MVLLLCIKKKNKAKVFSMGKLLSLLTMATVICQAIAEKVADNKGIELDQAMNFVVDSILESSKDIGK